MILISLPADHNNQPSICGLCSLPGQNLYYIATNLPCFVAFSFISCKSTLLCFLHDHYQAWGQVHVYLYVLKYFQVHTWQYLYFTKYFLIPAGVLCT